MPYNDQKIIRDADRLPVPQYFNESTNQYEPIKGRDGANSFIQLGTIAKEAWEGSGNITKTFPANRYGFSILNDGTGDLTFSINGQTRRVKPGEGYSALFSAFTQVTINTTSDYRAEVLT